MPKISQIHDHAVPLIELWRGDLLESVHHGHAVVMHANGAIVESWGQADVLMYPRSSCKMVQALPLIESGAGHALGSEQLALACASHQGAGLHVHGVSRWLSDLGLGEDDLRCGPQAAEDIAERDRLILAHERPCQLHNNCSGKHAGFLTLNRHLGGSSEYVEADHPVQRAVRLAFEEVTGMPSPVYGIDGCSAPNFATSLQGLALAMARFAGASDSGDARARAMVALRDAMMRHPELVAGETRACTELMRAMGGTAAVKTGAEAVFVAILPQSGLGIALKIVDGGVRAAEAAITALLVRHGALDGNHPVVARYLGDMRNRRDLIVGQIRCARNFCTNAT
ncbi:asparaginase [Roseinatronobacter alkalisoli]|uniref:Asparaginase n=1 Tax=Roseinatronobacter alkalisoli TaxID=3028235 RepID=A0ABT5T643_9RHOB|nr:asparaginase [Roseinatronobacter sp. HJB301]MDD7970446.1 asparaginase [Roseinatronobacter sp. HJB301]